MFDLGAAELLVIVIVAVVVIGPKDMPRALRTAGQWIGKVRRVSGHFRAGIDTMVREAELEEMEAKWKAQNEAIMAKTSSDDPPTASDASAEAALSEDDLARALDGEMTEEMRDLDGDDPVLPPADDDAAAAAKPEKG
jgi:sec-independent protein translocase protein TatB